MTLEEAAKKGRETQAAKLALTKEKLVGRIGTYEVNDTMSMSVRVLDVKPAYGKLRYLVAPLAGEGESWVWGEKVSLEDEPHDHTLCVPHVWEAHVKEHGRRPWLDPAPTAPLEVSELPVEATVDEDGGDEREVDVIVVSVIPTVCYKCATPYDSESLHPEEVDDAVRDVCANCCECQ